MAAASGSRVDAKDVTTKPLPTGIKVIIVFHILSTCLWLVGQTLSIFDYDFVAEYTGLVERRELTENAVVEFYRAIAIADTAIGIPLHVLSAYGLLQHKFYGAICSWMAFCFSMYWPSIFWGTHITFVQGNVKHPPLNALDGSIPALVFIFAVWGSWYQCHLRELILWWEKDLQEYHAHDSSTGRRQSST